MGRWIDRKKASTFELVHRSHRDPLYNDESASTRVFCEVGAKPGKAGSRGIKELESELGEIIRRDNEGEATNYGVYFDDTSYDYMQHLRPVGGGVLIDAPSSSLIPEEVLGSKVLVKKTYQDQQDVPDSISGFQPDMDPDLREALEALDDEAYMKEKEEAMFAELTQSGVIEANHKNEDEISDYNDNDDGWDSDDTIRGCREENRRHNLSGSQKKRLAAQKARTESTGYSMSSSSLFRNQGLTLLDDRFDRIEEEYEDDEVYTNFDADPSTQRADFMSIMDNFLEQTQVKGKRLRPKESGLEQLNDIRSQLRVTRL